MTEHTEGPWKSFPVREDGKIIGHAIMAATPSGK